MSSRIRYRKRPQYHVTAVQLDLDFEALSYNKWGSQQTARPGDWLINNNGDIYTVEKEYFRNHYEKISPGVYEKTGEIWAEPASEAGEIHTKEGKTAYRAGDYLVFDRETGGEGYAITKQTFEKMYEAVFTPLELNAQQQAYIDKRILPQIEYYDRTAIKNRSWYFSLQTIAVIAAAFVPVVIAFDADDAWPALLGGASAVIAGLLTLFKSQEEWVKTRSTCENLRSQLALFQAGVSPPKFREFAENCERIMEAERGQWAGRHDPDDDPTSE